MTIGVITLSYAKRAEHQEPNPVNQRLATATQIVTEHIAHDAHRQFVVVAQWEVALQLTRDGMKVDRVVTQADATRKESRLYLDSEDVIRVAAEHFAALGITDVVIVAKRFIHLALCRRLAAQHGLTVMTQFDIPKVGYDNDPRNLQWWCKGPIREAAYTGLQVLGKIPGMPNMHGIGERRPSA